AGTPGADPKVPNGGRPRAAGAYHSHKEGLRGLARTILPPFALCLLHLPLVLLLHIILDGYVFILNSVSYYSYYGKKPDPEPGRCRRTDGKKWRCSKDAYPGSKYCERHMHRGRNRSRKPVESQTVSPSQTSSSTLTSLSPSGSNAGGTGVGSFRSITLQSIAGPSNAQNSCLGGAGSSRLQMDTDSLGNRYFYPDFFTSTLKWLYHSFFSEASGTARALGVDSSVDSSWLLVPPQVSSFPMSKSQDLSVLQSAYSQLQTVQDLGQVKMSSLSRQEQRQHSFFGSEFGSSEPVKHETQFLRPFFDEWPKTRDAWSDLEEDRFQRLVFPLSGSSSLNFITPDDQERWVLHAFEPFSETGGFDNLRNPRVLSGNPASCDLKIWNLISSLPSPPPYSKMRLSVGVPDQITAAPAA
ncbi:hypothetical protein GW17_00025592, partial [Ensete ventricosum]